MPENNRSYRQQYQCRDLWCWAAVAVSLVRHFQPESKLTQCAFAREVFRQSTPPITADCCVGACVACGQTIDCNDDHQPYPDRCHGQEECNQRADPAVVLKVLVEQHGLRYNQFGVGRHLLPLIMDELRRDRPVVLRRDDGNGNGHILVAVGFRDGMVAIVDPEGDCKDYDPNPELRILSESHRDNPDVYTWSDTFMHA